MRAQFSKLDADFSGQNNCSDLHEPRWERNPKKQDTDFSDYADYTENPESYSHPSSVLVREGFAFEEHCLGTQWLPEVGSSQIEPVFRDGRPLGAANPPGLLRNRRNLSNLRRPLELRSHAESELRFHAELDLRS